MNFHDLTKAVSAKEGKKKSVNIAQINEIVSITLSELKNIFKVNPIKGTYYIIRLIYKAK